MKNIKMSFKLLKNPKYAIENNWYGFKQVDILEFNYDGKGSALAIVDGELDNADEETLRFLIWGGWYKRVA